MHNGAAAAAVAAAVAGVAGAAVARQLVEAVAGQVDQ